MTLKALKSRNCACLPAVYLAVTNPPLVYPVAHIFRVGPSVPSGVCMLRSLPACAPVAGCWREAGAHLELSSRSPTPDAVSDPPLTSMCPGCAGLVPWQGLRPAPALHHHLYHSGHLPGSVPGGALQQLRDRGGHGRVRGVPVLLPHPHHQPHPALLRLVRGALAPVVGQDEETHHLFSLMLRHSACCCVVETKAAHSDMGWT